MHGPTLGESSSISAWEKMLQDKIAESGMPEAERAAKFNKVREKLIYYANLNVVLFTAQSMNKQKYICTPVICGFTREQREFLHPRELIKGKVKEKYFPILQRLLEENWPLKSTREDSLIDMQLLNPPDSFPKMQVEGNDEEDESQGSFLEECNEAVINGISKLTVFYQECRKTERFTDCSIVCVRGEEVVGRIPAHRFVLATRSYVFEQYFAFASEKKQSEYLLNLDEYGVEMATVEAFVEVIYVEEKGRGALSKKTLRLLDRFKVKESVIMQVLSQQSEKRDPIIYGMMADQEVRHYQGFVEKKFLVDALAVIRTNEEGEIGTIPVHRLVFEAQFPMIPYQNGVGYVINLGGCPVKDIETVQGFIKLFYLIDCDSQSLETHKGIYFLSEHLGIEIRKEIVAQNLCIFYEEALQDAADTRDQKKIDELILDCLSFGKKTGMEELIHFADAAVANPFWRLQPISITFQHLRGSEERKI